MGTDDRAHVTDLCKLVRLVKEGGAGDRVMGSALSTWSGAGQEARARAEVGMAICRMGWRRRLVSAQDRAAPQVRTAA